MGVPETVICGPPGMRVWLPMMKSSAGFAVRVCEPSVIIGGLSREVTPLGFFVGVMPRVLVPMTTAVALGAKLIGVPETVIWGPPGIRVWVPMMKLFAVFAVSVCEPSVMSGGLGGEATPVTATVFPPMAIAVALGAKLIGVPETVISGPPGLRVLVPMMKLLAAFAVNASEPRVITGRKGGPPPELLGVIAIVLVPMTMAAAPDAKLMGVPDTVIWGPPGLRVLVPTMKLLAVFAVNASEPIVISRGLGEPPRSDPVAELDGASWGNGVLPDDPGVGAGWGGAGWEEVGRGVLGRKGAAWTGVADSACDDGRIPPEVGAIPAEDDNGGIGILTKGTSCAADEPPWYIVDVSVKYDATVSITGGLLNPRIGHTENIVSSGNASFRNGIPIPALTGT
jgi:hypothetical protein